MLRKWKLKESRANFRTEQAKGSTLQWLLVKSSVAVKYIKGYSISIIRQMKKKTAKKKKEKENCHEILYYLLDWKQPKQLESSLRCSYALIESTSMICKISTGISLKII